MQITEEDNTLFQLACQKIINQEKLRQGIGTLGEKTLHAVLKHYLDPRDAYHEIRCGRYVADILCEGEIIEIQTAQFNLLRRKLDAFLQEYEVTVVYPIPAVKWLTWIDEETGEISKKRKSPKTGSYYQAFYELYKIKQYLTHPRLHFRLLLIDMEEYRLLNGWSADKKRGASRFDRIPVALREELMISTVEDYKHLLPPSLPERFISKDYKKASGLSLKQAQTALNVLTYTGTIKKTGRQGRSILYER